MSKILYTTLLFCLFFSISSPNIIHAYETFYGPTQVTYWDKSKTDQGFILFQSFDTTYLINQNGQVINTWEATSKSYLLENGNLLSKISNDDDTNTFVELDWQGNKAWEYTETRQDYHPHHDFIKIKNPALQKDTLLYIANKSISNEEAIAAGADPQHGPYQNVSLDAIVEVDLQGNIVWEWWFFDHLVQDIDSSRDNYVGANKTIADYPGKLDINLPGKPLKKDWLHANSIDYNQDLGQIVINSVHGEFYVIDHDNTFVPNDPQESKRLAASDTGDFLYRFGDPARYQQGDKPKVLDDWNKIDLGHKQLGASHAASWIPTGYSGSGNFLVFNNGQYLYQPLMSSSVIEVDPFQNSDGSRSDAYVNPPDAGYTPTATKIGKRSGVPKMTSNQITWQFKPESHQSFLSYAGSYAQRLKNGNTFVCANREGHIFEITRDGEVVWEYINPLIGDGQAVTHIKASTKYDNVARCGGKYDQDYPGIKGKELPEKGLLTDLYGQNNQDNQTTDKTNNPISASHLRLAVCILISFGLGVIIKKNFR